jgi:hypothetical protein
VARCANPEKNRGLGRNPETRNKMALLAATGNKKPKQFQMPKRQIRAGVRQPWSTSRNSNRCALNEDSPGSVRYSTVTENSFEFRYSKVVGCSAVSGMSSMSNRMSAVGLSHFYENVVPVCMRRGFFVSACVFDSNTGEFFFDVPTGGAGYVILDCVLSNLLPVEAM